MFGNIGSMFRTIEKANNAQKMFGKPKQCRHKKNPGTAMLAVVCCSSYALTLRTKHSNEKKVPRKDQQHS